MATALSPLVLGTQVITTLSTVATEITFGPKPPKRITLEWESVAGSYAFTGTDGQAISATVRVDVDADATYTIDLRRGMARNLSVPSIFVQSASGTLRVLNVTVE